MKKRFWTEKGKLNNKGSAMLLVLTVISLIALLGFMSLSAAVTNWQIRMLGRKSERNFYFLETALDEVYSGLGKAAGECLEKSYEEVLEGLYTTYKTNDEANEAFAEKYLKSLEDSLGVDLNTIAHEEDSLAAKLKSYSDTVEQENLTVKIEKISYKDGSTPGDPAGTKDEDEETGRQQITLENLQLTYVNPTTQVESSVTADLTIRTPRVRFINEKDALNDYVLVANQGIKIEGDIAGGDECLLKGNIYGGNIEISQAKAVMESNLVTAGEELSVSNGGDLSIMPAGMGESDDLSEEEENESGMDMGDSMTSHIWAHNVRVFQASQLTVDGGNMYVQDDLTLQQDENYVKLTGGYYGYGNKGESAEPGLNVHSDSSAVLLNGKRNTVDFGEVDTLLLAGRAYLNFRDVSEAYPLGESISVKASQNIYLVPAEQISISKEDGNAASQAESNPLIFPPDQDNLVLTVKKDTEGGEIEGAYRVTRSELNGTVSYSTSKDSGENTAVIVGIKGKLYIYRSFESKEEQTEFFKKYLDENGDTFSGYLEKAGMGTADSGTAGTITLNMDNQEKFYTSASLYEVLGDGGKLFEIRNNENPTAIGIVDLSVSCESTYVNLKKYLAETVKADGGNGALPASTFVRLKAGGTNGDSVWDIENFEVLHRQDGNTGILMTNNDVVLNLSSKEAKAGATYSMPQGLIVTNGNVTVEGGGSEEWNGLILAGGTITVKGEAKLTADPETWASYLEDEQAAKYFYGYGDVDSSVFDRYEDFLILKNWKRGTRIHEEE